jgi:hypothetical protein
LARSIASVSGATLVVLQTRKKFVRVLLVHDLEPEAMRVVELRHVIVVLDELVAPLVHVHDPPVPVAPEPADTRLVADSDHNLFN